MIRRIFLFLVVFAGSFVISTSAHAATKYWIGSDAACTSGTFDDDGCWSTTSGGTNDTTAPTSVDIARFSSDDTADCEIDADQTISSIITQTGYTGEIDATAINLDVNVNLDLHTNSSFEGPGATKTLTIGEDLTLDNSLSYGTNGGTVIFDGGNPSIISVTTGRVVLDAVTIDKNTNTDITFGNTQINGLWTLTDGNLKSSGSSTIETHGDLSWGSVTDDNSNFPNITFVNNADVTIENIDRLGNVIVQNTNKADLIVDTATISGGLTMNSLRVDSGTFDNDANNNITVIASVSVDLNGGEIKTGTGTWTGNSIFIDGGTFTNQASTLSIGCSTCEIQMGSGTFTGGTGTIDVQSQNTNSSLDFNGGTFTSTSGSLIVEGGLDFESGFTFNHNSGTLESQMSSTRTWDIDSSSAFNNVIINQDTATAEVNLFSSLDINGNFTIFDGEFDANAQTINVAGDFNIVDEPDNQFISATSTVILDGTSQSVTGPFNDAHAKASAFYNFTKEVSSADTITFAANETFEFNNTLTLKGASGQLLSIRSDVADTQASFDPEGTRDIDFVDVKDNNNVSGTDIDVSNGNSVDSGNNTAWDFTGPSVIDVEITPSSPGDVDDLTLGYTLQGGATIAIINWLLDDNSITTLNLPFEANGGSESSDTDDFSGNDHAITGITAAWGSTNGRDSTGAYDFISTNSDYITITDADDIFPNNGAGNTSIEMWVNFDSISSYRAIFSKYDSGANERGVRLSMNNTFSCSTGTLAFEMTSMNGGGDYVSLCSNNVLSTGWHHIVLTYEPSTEMKIYFDGVDETDSFGLGSTPPPSINDNTKDLALGGDYSNSSAPDNGFFDGRIDNFRIYNRILTDEQITQLYNDDDFDVIVGEETELSDQWKGCVTPADSSNNYTEVCSAAVTVSQSVVDIPEFSTYVYMATLLGGFGYLWWKRREDWGYVNLNNE